MKPPGKRKRKSEPEDDGALWQHVAAGVQPLARRNRFGPVELPEPKPVKTKAPRTPPRPVAHVRLRADKPIVPPAELAAGSAPGLDRRTAMRLRRGQLSVDARIDLHGHTRDAAHTALNRFLRTAHERGARCVLVITGKGRFGEGGGVIRSALAGWLNDSALRSIVVAFAQAQPKDGGGGAFYVYLRRMRER